MISKLALCHRIFGLLACLCLPLPSIAQAEQKVFLRALAWDASVPESLLVFQAGVPIRIGNVQRSRRSEMAAYQGPPEFYLYAPDAVWPPPDSAIPPPMPLAQVSLPPGMRHPLLILMPKRENHAIPHEVMVIDEDPRNFPFPSFLLINASERPIGISLGQDALKMAPGESRVVESKESPVNLLLALSIERNQGWQVVYDDFFPNWPGERVLLFVQGVERNGRTRLEPRSVLENESAWTRALENANEEAP